MNRKDPRIFISHTPECLEKIEQYFQGKSKEDFLGIFQLQHGVIRRIEVIGKAARNIPDEIPDEYLKIQWNEAKGLRNILIH